MEDDFEDVSIGNMWNNDRSFSLASLQVPMPTSKHITLKEISTRVHSILEKMQSADYLSIAQELMDEIESPQAQKNIKRTRINMRMPKKI